MPFYYTLMPRQPDENTYDFLAKPSCIVYSRKSFMTQPQPSIDGFIPRRPTAIGVPPPQRPQNGPSVGLSRGAVRSDGASSGLASSRQGLSRAEIDASLRAIETDIPAIKPTRQRPRGFYKNRARRIVKWLIILFVVVFLSVAGWITYKTLSAGGSIFKGNLLGLIQSQPLKADSNGRSNILVLGTSEDDPGHTGAYLTDSMIVVSIDQKNKTVAMFSVPRDLYVRYGMSCGSGDEGKINEYFSCVNNDMTNPTAEQERLTKTRQFVGKIFGLDIQYGVHVNNTVIKEAVDAVGGIDINIQGSNGAPGILDRNFDWRCKYKCYYVKYSNGMNRLDGQQALFLAMARGDVAPTYGLANSNFDREKNQQKIILALKQKAVSTGTLTDVSKVTKLIDTLGNNLRTNIDTTEIRTLMQLGRDIKPQDMTTVSLYDGDSAVVTSGNYGGASVVRPVAGLFNYTDLRAYIRQKLSTNPVTKENAQIDVYNASTTPGVAQTEADNLTAKGFIVGRISNTPRGNYGPVEIYQVGSGNQATKAKLESLYKVTVKSTAPPVTTSPATKFILIFSQTRS